MNSFQEQYNRMRDWIRELRAARRHAGFDPGFTAMLDDINAYSPTDLDGWRGPGRELGPDYFSRFLSDDMALSMGSSPRDGWENTPGRFGLVEPWELPDGEVRFPRRNVSARGADLRHPVRRDSDIPPTYEAAVDDSLLSDDNEASTDMPPEYTIRDTASNQPEGPAVGSNTQDRTESNADTGEQNAGGNTDDNARNEYLSWIFNDEPSPLLQAIRNLSATYEEPSRDSDGPADDDTGDLSLARMVAMNNLINQINEDLTAGQRLLEGLNRRSR